MRDCWIHDFDGVDRPLVAISRTYPEGCVLPWHHHRRAQLLYGASGTMQVDFGASSWIVPPWRAVWIPAGTPHQVKMQGVTTCSLFVEPVSAPRAGGGCEGLEITPLMRRLLIAASDLPAEYGLGDRDEALVRLVLHELADATAVPEHIPIPDDPRLADLCRSFLKKPTRRSTPTEWARRLNVSERSFDRRFQKAVGMKFADWRTRACVVSALPRLGAGESVTRIAFDLGYESPPAFTTMVKRVLGAPATAFSRRAGRGISDDWTQWSRLPAHAGIVDRS